MQQDESTALHVAAREGHQETVLALLQAGADVHAKDEVRGGLVTVMLGGLFLCVSLQFCSVLLCYTVSLIMCALPTAT
jgi:hypothetical protein